MWQSGGCGGCMPVSLLYHRMNGLGAGNQCGLLLIYVLHRTITQLVELLRLAQSCDEAWQGDAAMPCMPCHATMVKTAVHTPQVHLALAVSRGLHCFTIVAWHGMHGMSASSATLHRTIARAAAAQRAA